MSKELRLPGHVDFYVEARPEGIDLPGLRRYLQSLFPGIDVRLRGSISSSFFLDLEGGEKEKKAEELAKRLAAMRIRDAKNPAPDYEPLPGEIAYEKRKLLSPDEQVLGILYDGLKLSGIFSGLLPPDEAGLDYCRIVFTSRLVGSWDEGDLRFHARAAIFSFPSIISTAGIVEAPARPREFYLKSRLGTDPHLLKEEFKERFIDYDDPRMEEAAKGYLLQALFFHITGVPFCDDKNCRLYNAHWQEELIQAQIKSEREFCPRHEQAIKNLR